MAILFGKHSPQNDPEAIRFQREWFEWATAENTTSMQQALAEGQDINEVVLEGRSAASIAALTDKMRLFEWLRENGADFQSFDGHKMNALMCSAYAGTVRIAAKLLSRGDPDKELATTNDDKRTALHFSVLTGRAQMTQFLLTKGADYSARDIDGNTPLHLSMKGGSPLVVRLLLEAGSDPTAENTKGQTPEKMSGSLSACRQAIAEGPSMGSGVLSGFKP